jgi:hypothetical protein
MRLYGPSRHLELAGDFRIVTTLQKQFDDLLFARAQPNGLFFHHCKSPFLASPRPKTVARLKLFQNS